MKPEDQIRRVLELVNSYNASDIRAANSQLQEWQRISRQNREDEDLLRYLLIGTFTFVRGGWHDLPLLKMPASQFRSIVDDLKNKPDEEIKRELDAGIPEYFRHNDHAALRDMINGWNLFPEQRMQILEDAFEAHKCDKYTLSISALAPQIEGILRDETGKGYQYMREVNKMLGFHYNRKPPSPAPTLQDYEKALEDLQTLDLPERWQKAEQFELHHALFRVNELYNYVDFQIPKFANSTNRNAIAHGVFRDFNERTSIKLFCSMQLAHEIMVAYREKPAQTRRKTNPVSGLSSRRRSSFPTSRLLFPGSFRPSRRHGGRRGCLGL